MIGNHVYNYRLFTFYCSETNHADAGLTAGEIVMSSKSDYDCWKAQTKFIYAVGDSGKAKTKFMCAIIGTMV